jgi:penicillin amidase
MSDAQLADLDPPYPYDRHPVIVTDLTDASASRSAAAIAVPPEVDLAGLADRLGPLAELEARLPALLGTRGSSGVGSNSFVVDGSRTTSGMPILANDPHLGPSMPGIWHQVGLHCREVGDACPFDVSGFSFSGFPGIVLGHTDRVAWGFTNLGPDVQDLYLEDVQGDRVRIGDQMVDLDIRTETIEVAGGDPLSIRVRSTRHGPLLSDVSDWYASAGALAPIPGERPDSLAAPDFALQWTASTPGRTADAVFLINQAQDWDDFREAAELFEVPSQNMIYADVDGHIGYQAPGKIPIREAGDGRWPAPGWDSDYDWAGFVDFEEMPWMLDPADGFIATANNAVTDPDYPVYLTSDWSLGDRAARLVELIEGAGPMTVETAMALSFDNHGPIADVLLPALQSLPKPSLPEPVGEFPESPWNALLLFDDWDGQQTADSGGAAVLNAVWRHLLFRTFGDEFADLTQIPPDGGDRWLEMMRTLLEEPGAAWWDDTTTGDVVETRDDILAAAVDDAVVELSGVLGDQPEDWHWGALHTLTLRNASLGESGIAPIEMLFNRGPFETAGGGDVLNATGWYAPDGYEVTWVPSMRMVVDLADLDASRYVNLTGVSGHAFHEHYDDQTPLWAAGDSIAWPFTPTAVEGATVDLLTLQPD